MGFINGDVRLQRIPSEGTTDTSCLNATWGVQFQSANVSRRSEGEEKVKPLHGMIFRD